MMPRRKAKKAQSKPADIETVHSPGLRQTLLPFSPTAKDKLEAAVLRSELHLADTLDRYKTAVGTDDAELHLTDDEQSPKSDDHNCPASLNTSSSDGESVVFVGQEQKPNSPLKRDLEGKGLSDSEAGDVEKPISPRKRERRGVTVVPAQSIPPCLKLEAEPAKTKKKAGGRRSKSAGCVNARPQKASSPVIDVYNIETYFPSVRRSSRREEKAIKEIYERDVIRKVIDGAEEGMKVIDFGDKGRGVIATRQFGQNEFVVEYAGDLISITEADRRNEAYAADATVGCYMFWITHAGKKYCVDATAESGRLGRLINHSRKSGNLYPKVKEIEGGPRLLLYASRRIFAGEELLYDYGERAKKTLEDFPWLKT